MTVHDRRFSYPFAWQVRPPEGSSSVVCHVHFKDPYTEDRPTLWQRLAVQGYGCASFNESGCVGITAYAEADVVLPKQDEAE